MKGFERPDIQVDSDQTIYNYRILTHKLYSNQPQTIKT